MKPLRSVLTRGQRYKGHVSSSRYGLAVNVEGCTHKGTCVSRGGRPIRTAATLSDGDVLEHYHGITSTYHASWFYSKTSPYESWQLELISDAFKCSDTTRNAQLKIADIGGGTGRFAHLLYHELGVSTPVLCVDVSKDMLDEAAELDGVRTLQSDAIKFAEDREHPREDSTGFDRMLLKEVVHHIDTASLPKLFESLYGRLREDGRLLILTRPRTGIEYPFFPDALEVWERNQPDQAHLEELLRESGFRSVTSSVESFPVSMHIDEWLGMVRNRMWSTFSSFTEAELEEGIRHIRETYATDRDGNVRFNEKVVLVKATRHG